MCLGNVLLQPQRLQRELDVELVGDAQIVDDLLRLISRLALNPAISRDIFLGLEESFEAWGNEILDEVEGGFENAGMRIRSHFSASFTQLETFLGSELSLESADDFFDLLAQALEFLVNLAKNLTINQLRLHMTELVAILEQELGLTGDFLERQVWRLIDGLISRMRALGRSLTGEARAVCFQVARLLKKVKRLFYGQFQLPRFNADQMATDLLALIRKYGYGFFMDEVTCMLDKIRDFYNAGRNLVDVVGTASFDAGSLGAAKGPDFGDKYAWYASWLMGDKTRPWYYALFDWLPAFPLDEVWIADDGKQLVLRNVARDDELLHESTSQINWYDARRFTRQPTPPDINWTFKRVEAQKMEDVAYWMSWGSEWVRQLIFLIGIGERDFAGNFFQFMWSFTNLVYKGFTKNPMMTHLNSGAVKNQMFRWLWVPFIPLGVSFLTALEGRHTEADADAGRVYMILWADDLIDALSVNLAIDWLRDITLTIMTQLNYDGPTYPETEEGTPMNIKYVEAFQTLTDFFFNWLLIKIMNRESYTHPNTDDNIGGRQVEIFFGWGLLGGLLSNLASTLLANGMGIAFSQASSKDVVLKNLGKGAIKTVLSFWLMIWINMYFNGEGDTAGGEYNPAGLDFDGYPDNENSPYLLPYRQGTTEFVGQGNQGMWSHHVTRPNGTPQVYAYDFSMDQGTPILASRAGTVVDFFDWVPDDQKNTTTNGPTGVPPGTTSTQWNFVLIRHDNHDPDHDKGPDGVPYITYGVYGHGRFGSVRELLQPCTPNNDLREIIGLQVQQGQPIMRTGNTGISNHNHLHMDIRTDEQAPPTPANPLPAVGLDPATGNVTTIRQSTMRGYTIPFVFRDVNFINPFKTDGVPTNLSWCTSDNELNDPCSVL